MQVTETKTEGLTREFKIVVPAADIEGQVETRLGELKNTVRIPGFRPGKVPAALMRKKYVGAVMGEVLEHAVGEANRKAFADHGVRPATQPKVEVTAFAEGQDLEYTLTVEILPEIPALELSALELERVVAEPEDAEIQAALDRLAAAHKTNEAIGEDRGAAKGDILTIDFVGRIDGVEFPGGKAEDYALDLGSGTFIPGFEDQLVGAKAGGRVEVKVSFPADYGAAELAGKDAVFDVDVKSIGVGKPAAIDDELAKKLGTENLDALRKSIRDAHERELKDVSRLRLKRVLLDKLAERYAFEVPASMKAAEAEGIWKQFEEQRKAGRLEEAEFAGKSDDDIKAEFATIAERRVRLALVLAEVARANSIQIGQDEMNRALMNEARRYPGHEKEVIEFFRKNPQAMESLRGPLMEDKVVDFVIEMAKVTERKVAVADLLKDPDAEEAPKAAEEEAPKKKSSRKSKKDESAEA